MYKKESLEQYLWPFLKNGLVYEVTEHRLRTLMSEYKQGRLTPVFSQVRRYFNRHSGFIQVRISGEKLYFMRRLNEKS